MGIIDKYSLDRMGDSEVKVTFNCPRCKKHRITMAAEKELDFWNGVACPKCDARIVLDSFSLAIINDEGEDITQEKVSVRP